MRAVLYAAPDGLLGASGWVRALGAVIAIMVQSRESYLAMYLRA